jgi:predicted DNA-binding transcriptional regulator AlpA
MPATSLAATGSPSVMLTGAASNAAPRTVEAMMRNTSQREMEVERHLSVITEAGTDSGGRHVRLLTAFDVAERVGCHEESVRRAYLCGQLKRQRFGVRSWRFHPSDVEDWVRRGASTRIS